MPFIQNVKEPKQDIRAFKLSQFEGGLNNADSPFELNDNESPNLLNVITYERGVIETRPGTFKYLTEILGETIYKIFIYATATTSEFICSSATKLYTIDTTGGAITQLATVSKVVSGFQFDNSFFFIDGTKFREYDGTNVYDITQPLSLTNTAVAGGASTITLASDASATDDAYNGYEIYIGAGTGIGQTRTISDYVGSTKVATVSVAWDIQPDDTSIYYATSTAQGTTTTVGTPIFTKTYSPTYLEYTDLYKGGNNISDTVKCSWMTLHKQRFFFSVSSTNTNLFYYTDLDNPYYIPTNRYEPVVTNNDDTIQGTYSFNDVLCIFKKGTIFALYGDDESNYEMKEVAVTTGTVNINTVAQVNNELFYLGTNGKVFALYDVRTDYKKLLSKIVSAQLDFNKEPINLYDVDYASAHAIFFDRFYMLSVGDRMMIYSIGFGWLVWSGINPTCFIKFNNVVLCTNTSKYILRITFNRFYVTETFTATANQTNFTVSKGYLNELSENTDALVYVGAVPILTSAEKISNTEFKIAPVTAGQTVKIEYLSLLSYNDDGSSYEAYWESKDLDFGFPGFTKQLRRLYLTASTYKYFTSTVTFDLLIDYYEYSTNFVMKNQITLWGQAQFGDTFIDRNIVDSRPIDINKRGRIIRFRIHNDQKDQPFKIYNIFGEAIVRHK